MYHRERVIQILNRARSIDRKCEKFGASKHQYRLNPPIDAAFVHSVEEQYGFVLPEDYFRFITEVGDGGAGPSYGIEPFSVFLEKGQNPQSERYREAYRRSLAEPFAPRPMARDEVENYAIARREVCEQAPSKYFVCEILDDEALCDSSGFWILGTHGCQWDFGLIVSGERRGQVFNTDNAGAYGWVSDNFEEFYQNWLEQIADGEKLKKELEGRRKLFQRIRQIK